MRRSSFVDRNSDQPGAGIDDLKDTFNDIGLADFWKFIVVIRACMDESVAHTDKSQPAVVEAVLPLRHYAVGVCAIPAFSPNSVSMMEAAFRRVSSLLKSGSLRPGPVLMCECDLRAQIIADFTSQGLSQLELLIDELKKNER